MGWSRHSQAPGKLLPQFEKASATVFLGGLGANLVYLVAIPLVTRLYAAETLGHYQLLLSIVTVVASVASLKYEMGIVLPKTERDAQGVLILAALSLGLVTAASTVSVLALPKVLESRLPEAVGRCLWLVPVGVVAKGGVEIARFWLLAASKYRDLAWNRFYHVGGAQLAAVLGGLVRPTVLTFFAAQTLGQVLAILRAFRMAPLRRWGFKAAELRGLAKRHSKLPLVTTWSVLLVNLTSQIPVFMLVTFADAAEAGFYMIATRLLDRPLGLIRNSVQQVYFREGSQIANEGRQGLYDMYRATVRKLAIVGVPILTAVAIGAPLITAPLLGHSWEVTGRYLQILVIWKSFEFVTAPISVTLVILNKQERALLLRVGTFLMRLAAMYYFRSSALAMVLAYCCASAVHYVALNVLIWFSLVENREEGR